jgi:hypothetical protein
MTSEITRQVAVRGGQLPVWARAGNGPAVIFLRYWGGSHRTFAPVIARLPSGTAALSYDNRGWRPPARSLACSANSPLPPGSDPSLSVGTGALIRPDGYSAARR